MFFSLVWTECLCACSGSLGEAEVRWQGEGEGNRKWDGEDGRGWERISCCPEICTCGPKAEGGSVFRGNCETWGNVEKL